MGAINPVIVGERGAEQVVPAYNWNSPNNFYTITTTNTTPATYYSASAVTGGTTTR